ncbi:MAG: S1 RNA-binding domain-containing protein [Bacillota bacterium]|nr:S1 RNA-binding domain-containing protein [Bacillota bacterium]
MTIVIGEITDGRVTGITKFGAFVEIAGPHTGLVHISEVADAYIRDINDILKVGDSVLVKIISSEGGKIGLSIKQAQTAPPVYEQAPEQPLREGGFEDQLARFMKDSNEKMASLKKHRESKKGR